MNADENKLLNIVRAGIFAAMTTLLTALLHIPVGNGYIHCGDALIYLAAAMLPLPYAVCAGAVGGMMADILSGYAVYALPTLLIKGLLALTFSLIGGEKLFSVRRILAGTVCGVITVVGYYLTAVFLYGGWRAQLAATVPGDSIQAAASCILYTAAALSLEKLGKRNQR